LASPPIAGLHDIRPIESRDAVRRPTRRPIRVAAFAASIPAWPAPTTRTSKEEFSVFSFQFSVFGFRFSGLGFWFGM